MSLVQKPDIARFGWGPIDLVKRAERKLVSPTDQVANLFVRGYTLGDILRSGAYTWNSTRTQRPAQKLSKRHGIRYRKSHLVKAWTKYFRKAQPPNVVRHQITTLWKSHFSKDTIAITINTHNAKAIRLRMKRGATINSIKRTLIQTDTTCREHIKAYGAMTLRFDGKRLHDRVKILHPCTLNIAYCTFEQPPAATHLKDDIEFLRGTGTGTLSVFGKQFHHKIKCNNQ